MKDLKGFITPPDHINFNAKKIFGENGKIQDGAIAYLEPGGGGPIELHTHPHNHLFIVVSGEAKVIIDNQEVVIHENESFLVDGERPHSVWNNTNQTTIMLGISIKPEST